MGRRGSRWPPRLHQLLSLGGLAAGGARLLRRRLLRCRGLARGLLLRCRLLLCYCHSASLLSGWLVVHSSYIHSSLHTHRIRDTDRKSTRLNSSHLGISYAVFCF